MFYKRAPIIVVIVFFIVSLGIAIATLKNFAVHAAGKATSLSVTSMAVSTPTDTMFSYTATTEYGIGDFLRITVPSSVVLANCTSSTIDADGDTITDGSASVSSNTYTYTFSASTTQASSTQVSFCINLSSTTAGNYSVAFTDSKANPSNNDYGISLTYIGDANDVTVTAQVPPSLAFVIRNSADTANTNTCALGVLSLAAVNTCAYRLKITTNSASGFTAQINTDGDLRKSGSGDVADALDIDIQADLSTVTAGTEGYGIAFAKGSITGGTTTGGSAAGYNYTNDDTPLPISSVKTLYTANGVNNPTSTDTTNTALVTHRAAMDGHTATGQYSQLVTYTVFALF